jgi:CBS-domain-containing membrane protein
LNGGEVNAIYERLKNEKYPKPYMVELQNLKSNFETTQANLEVSRFDLETTKLELDNQKRRNDDLERRLANLEMSKETENK